MGKMILKTPVERIKVRLNLDADLVRKLRENAHYLGTSLDDVAEQALDYAFKMLERPQ
ncbi:MAG: hypothetical protein WCK63_17010 [Betaproteobacteria bacterium]